ncbi:hypothetical protein HMI56_001296 [Coelomomyces lativittatus]|nr:hypothetical protein HMI56_001296 [Coelomomyces lativittatus]
MKYWPVALWADHVIIHENGFSAYYLFYGKDPFMAIDFEFKTWPMEIKYPLKNEDLLTLHLQQLQELSQNQTLAMLTIKDLGERKKVYKTTHSKEEMPKEKDYVLVRASDVEENKGMKL